MRDLSLPHEAHAFVALALRNLQALDIIPRIKEDQPLSVLLPIQSLHLGRRLIISASPLLEHLCSLETDELESILNPS